MRIAIDDRHYLNSDQYCYWITAQIVPENGNAYERRVSGYTATFRQAVDSYLEKKIRSSEADSVAQLAAEIDELKETVNMWLDAIGDKGIGGADA